MDDTTMDQRWPEAGAPAARLQRSEHRSGAAEARRVAAPADRPTGGAYHRRVLSEPGTAVADLVVTVRAGGPAAAAAWDELVDPPRAPGLEGGARPGPVGRRPPGRLPIDVAAGGRTARLHPRARPLPRLAGHHRAQRGSRHPPPPAPARADGRAGRARAAGPPEDSPAERAELPGCAAPGVRATSTTAANACCACARPTRR